MISPTLNEWSQELTDEQLSSLYCEYMEDNPDIKDELIEKAFIAYISDTEDHAYEQYKDAQAA